MSPGPRRCLWAAAVLVAALVTSACTAGTEPETKESVPPKKTEAEGSVTLWHFFSGREADAIQSVIDDFQQKFPKITVEVRKEQDDEKMRQAISAGQGPDVGVSYSTAIVGSFCTTGAFRDLTPYIERDGVDLNILPQTVRDYTEFDGVRCAMPMLADAYGLYYNKKLLADAGFDGPPQTAEELAEMAKKLTKRSPDGKIEVAGFVPSFGFFSGNTPEVWAPAWGAKWLTEDLDPVVGEDQAWEEMLTWQKELVDWYGIDNLNKFTAGIGQEWSAEHPFYHGKIAMMLDGEWRNAFIAAEAPDLDYGTAPFPGPESRSDLYGAGYVTGTIAGISKGSQNPEAAWELLRYLTTETEALVKLSNLLKNVPTTQESLTSPDLEVDENFQTFVDIFQNENSDTTPASPAGAEGYTATMGDFAERWQNGKIDDLVSGLDKVDEQMKADLGRSAP